MTIDRRRMSGLLLLCSVVLSACAAVAEGEDSMSDPATLETIDGSDVSRITLTSAAARRVDIEVASTRASGSDVVIPYAALFYTPSGDVWAYTNPQPLTFVRVPVVVDRIRGGRAYLSSGPREGMPVVTQGSAELYGTETDVEE